MAPDAAIGRGSGLDTINNKSVNEAALRQARKKFYAQQLALDNIHNPSFVPCSRCVERIPMGRIATMPESSPCMRCL
ncbi:MAG: TraR/DksA family transcriptional regulator [Bacteroidota bacterium]